MRRFGFAQQKKASLSIGIFADPRINSPCNEKSQQNNHAYGNPQARRWRPEWRRIGNNNVTKITETVRIRIHSLARSARRAEEASHLVDDVALVADH